MNVLLPTLPVFCHNKATEFFVSSEKQESEWRQGRKGPASFVQSFKGSHLKEAGIRKFLPIKNSLKNSLADLRQEKNRESPYSHLQAHIKP